VILEFTHPSIKKDTANTLKGKWILISGYMTTQVNLIDYSFTEIT